MATLDDVKKSVMADPVAGYVAIPIVAIHQPDRPSRFVTIKMRGRTLLLPDWTGSDWAWYGNLAFEIAKRQTVNNPAGQTSKDRALTNLKAVHPQMVSLGSVKPDLPQVSEYYDRCVRLVIASNAATTGETRGRMAWDAFTFGLANAPKAIVDSLMDVLKTGGELFFKDMPRAASRVLADVFDYTVGGTLGAIFSGLGIWGPILIVGGLWYLTRGKRLSAKEG